MRHLALLSFLLIAVPFTLPASVDRELLALVPPDTRALASVDVTHAQSSNFGQYLLQHLNQNGAFDRLVAETGFDPRQDLQQIVIATSGAPGKFAVLARGVFDMDRIRAAAKAKGATVVRFHGHNIIVNSHDENQSSALAFPLGDVAVLGDVPTVHAILDNSNVPSTLDPALTAQIGAFGEKNDAWFAALPGSDGFGNGLMLEGDRPDAQMKTLQSIVQAAGGIHYGDTVDVTFEALARSPQDATSLADVVRLGASMLQMQRQKDPRAAILASAFDNMDLKATGDRMRFSLSLPEKVLEQLLEQAHPAKASLKSSTR